MARKLHELLAVQGRLKGTADKIMGEAVTTFTKKADHFTELHKSYEPIEEDGDQEPDEISKMADTVFGKLDHVARFAGKYIDAQFQIETTDASAVGTIELPGVTIPDVPVTALMALEHRLDEIRQVYLTLPTLDPKHEWTIDSSRGSDIYQAMDEVKYRTKAKFQFQVMVPATDRHPAQVREWSDQVRVGRTTTKRWSGAVTPAVKSEMLARIDEFQNAVKKARSSANEIEHSTDTISEQIFAFINGDTL